MYTSAWCCLIILQYNYKLMGMDCNIVLSSDGVMIMDHWDLGVLGSFEGGSYYSVIFNDIYQNIISKHCYFDCQEQSKNCS